MLEPIVITHDLPPVLIALNSDTLEAIDTLTMAVHSALVTDEESWRTADTLCKQSCDLVKRIEDERKTVTRPLDDLKAKVMEAARVPLQPLRDGVSRLAMEVRAYQVAQERIHAERVRAAQAEAARLQAIEDERARLAYQQANDDLPPDMVPAVMEHAPVAVRAAVIPPPPKAMSVKRKVERHVVITDDALVPVTIAGACIRPVDLAAVKRLLSSGVKIPGCELVESESFARKG